MINKGYAMSQGRETTNDKPIYRIRLEAARSKNMPDGEHNIAYEFMAPLTADGHIDVEAWHHLRAHCFVHHIVNGDIEERGLLVHRAGGSGGARWAFQYDRDDEGDEGYNFASHAFRVGEYVSVRESDSELRTYRVAHVTKI
jgi:hypothetical protein